MATIEVDRHECDIIGTLLHAQANASKEAAEFAAERGDKFSSDAIQSALGRLYALGAKVDAAKEQARRDECETGAAGIQ